MEFRLLLWFLFFASIMISCEQERPIEHGAVSHVSPLPESFDSVNCNTSDEYKAKDIREYQNETTNYIEAENRESIDQRRKLVDEQCSLSNDLERLEQEIKNPVIECATDYEGCDSEKIDKYL